NESAKAWNKTRKSKFHIHLTILIFLFSFASQAQTTQYTGPPVEKDVTIHINESYSYSDTFSGESHWQCTDSLKVNNLPTWMSKEVKDNSWKVKGSPTKTGNYTAEFKVQELADALYFDHCIPSDATQANEGASPTTNGEDSYYVTLNFTVIDASPKITSNPIKNAKENELYNYAVISNEQEGQDIIYTMVSGPSLISFTVNTLSCTTDYNNAGNYKIKTKVFDGNTSDTQSYTLADISVNRQPKLPS